MATTENTKAAYSGESEANRKYAAFAEKADEEGYKTVARIFRAASEAEAIHAKRLLKVMGAIGTTKTNLNASVAGETHEYTEMYPAFVKEAADEKQSDAGIAFTYAMKAEEVHANLYRDALAVIEKGVDVAAKKVLLCPVCGNIFLGDPPDRCPICNVAKKIFKEIV
ncbi:MAG: rubrerythrin family protein [Methanomicrobiales archaeon]|nr:rubrerythrin family protein [Methanomicrobiales archaeon]